MDGDTPLDFWYEVCKDILPLPRDKHNCMDYEKVTPVMLDRGLAAIVRLIDESRRWGEGGTEYNCIAWQVVGFQFMKHGAALPGKVRKRIIKACETELVEDFWEGRADRRMVVRNLMETVKAYESAHPVDLGETGLFEKIGMVMARSGGVPALINEREPTPPSEDGGES
jgi:hypothetical protein